MFDAGDRRGIANTGQRARRRHPSTVVNKKFQLFRARAHVAKGKQKGFTTVCGVRCAVCSVLVAVSSSYCTRIYSWTRCSTLSTLRSTLYSKCFLSLSCNTAHARSALHHQKALGKTYVDGVQVRSSRDPVLALHSTNPSHPISTTPPTRTHAHTALKNTGLRTPGSRGWQ